MLSRRQQDADTHNKLLKLQTKELALWLEDAHCNRRMGTYPLIGKITAMAHVYCRTDEAAYPRSEDDDQDVATGMSELWPQRTLIH